MSCCRLLCRAKTKLALSDEVDDTKKHNLIMCFNVSSVGKIQFHAIKTSLFKFLVRIMETRNNNHLSDFVPEVFFQSSDASLKLLLYLVLSCNFARLADFVLRKSSVTICCFALQ